MSRNKGTFNFAANYEPLIKAPLDARMIVGSYTDLILASTWEDSDSNIWLYDGALVVVANDPSAGIYWLKDSTNYTSYSSWEMAGSGSSIDGSIYDYIDGSLAARDSSIDYLYTRTLVNKGDASGAEVYVGEDASGNFALRSILGSGAALVEQVGNNIVISLDASFAGEVNYGQNVGSGDVSIYYQKLGDALQFRTLSGGSNISLDVSNNTISINSTGGDVIDGGVWITDITPTGSGNVGDKVYISSGNVLESCLADTSSLTVDVIAVPGHSNYEPSVGVYGVPVNLTIIGSGPQWSGSVDIVFDTGDSSITAVHEDGASWSTEITQDIPPIISSAMFTDGYPSGQSELKAGDTFDVYIVTDVDVDRIEFSGSSYAPVPEIFNVTLGSIHTVTVTISDQGNTTQDLGFNVRVRKPTGSWSNYFLSTSQGLNDGIYRVKLNNTYPSITIGAITYPASQQALKNSETATVSNTVVSTGMLSYNYTAPGGEINIANPVSYETSKSVSRQSGDYNISTPNFTLTVTRTENQAVSSESTIVNIANVAPILEVSNPASRLRSGGNDGTSVQNHTITINSNQSLLNAPTLQVDSGTDADWQSSPTFSGSGTTWTNNLLVHDDDQKGEFNWGAILGTGLSGLTTTSNAGTATYTLGGFVARDLTVAGYGTTATFNTAVVNYSKISNTLNWSVKSLPNKRAVGTIATPDAGGWAIDALNINPTTINILDTQATGSSSQASVITGFQESV